MADATETQVAATEANDPWTVNSATPSGEVTQTPPAPVEPVAAVSDDLAPEPVEAVSQPVRDDKGQFAKASRKTNPHEAVKQATGEAARERERAAKAEQRAAELERLLAERAEPTRTADPEPSTRREPSRPKPVWDDTKYASYEDFTDDRADWLFEQKLASGELDQRVEQRFQQHLTRQQEQQRKVSIREAGMKAYPDWQTVIDGAVDAKYPNAVLQLPDEAIPHVIYAIAKDPALSQKLVSLLDNPVALGLELAQLLPSSGVANQPGSTPTTRVSSALPPVSRVGGTASAVPVDPDELEFGPEYIRKGNEADKKRREANRW